MDGKHETAKLKQDGSQSQLVLELPGHLFRAAGILKYIRESTDHGLAFDPQPEAPLQCMVKCEDCGQKVSPSLDEICLHGSKAASFCCVQWEHIYRLLMRMRKVSEGNYEDIPTANDSRASRPLVYQRKDKLSMFLMDATKEDKSEPRHFEDYLFEMPVPDTGATESNEKSNVISFRLSCPPVGSWVKIPENKCKKKADMFDAHLNDDISTSICDHGPLEFGLCHHQDGGDFVQKYYPDGFKFLLVLDDGSAQVYYPSGLLAILVTVTVYGRVCIVYDDAPGQPMRALFQSDGKGTCYHPNGHIWLIYNQHGGQTLDPEGARVLRWTWHNGSTPLRPVFQFINRSIGIRVLGKQQIFVSFLAHSRQAKFNVGAWCQKGSCKMLKIPPRLAKDELMALACRVRSRVLLQKCQGSMNAPSQAPHLQLQAQKLLKASESIDMDEDDRDILQSCLQVCLEVQH